MKKRKMESTDVDDMLMTDADFERALDILQEDDEAVDVGDLLRAMNENRIISWEEAERILCEASNEPVKSSLPQQTRPSEPDNDTDVDLSIQRLLRNDPKLVEINLNNMKRTPIPQIRRILEALRENTCLEKISLANMGLYDTDIAPLIDVIEDSETLRAVNVETNYLSGEFFARLLRAALKNQTLEEIKGVNQGVSFSTAAEREIIDAVFQNRGLTKVSINLRLPEGRHKIEQATIRNQEIRRLLRRQAAEATRAAQTADAERAAKAAARMADISPGKISTNGKPPTKKQLAAMEAAAAEARALMWTRPHTNAPQKRTDEVHASLKNAKAEEQTRCMATHKSVNNSAGEESDGRLREIAPIILARGVQQQSDHADEREARNRDSGEFSARTSHSPTKLISKLNNDFEAKHANGAGQEGGKIAFIPEAPPGRASLIAKKFEKKDASARKEAERLARRVSAMKTPRVDDVQNSEAKEHVPRTSDSITVITRKNDENERKSKPKVGEVKENGLEAAKKDSLGVLKAKEKNTPTIEKKSDPAEEERMKENLKLKEENERLKQEMNELLRLVKELKKQNLMVLKQNEANRQQNDRNEASEEGQHKRDASNEKSSLKRDKSPRNFLTNKNDTIVDEKADGPSTSKYAKDRTSLRTDIIMENVLSPKLKRKSPQPRVKLANNDKESEEKRLSPEKSKGPNDAEGLKIEEKRRNETRSKSPKKDSKNKHDEHGTIKVESSKTNGPTPIDKGDLEVKESSLTSNRLACKENGFVSAPASGSSPNPPVCEPLTTRPKRIYGELRLKKEGEKVNGKMDLTNEANLAKKSNLNEAEKDEQQDATIFGKPLSKSKENKNEEKRLSAYEPLTTRQRIRNELISPTSSDNRSDESNTTDSIASSGYVPLTTRPNRNLPRYRY